MTPSVSPVPGFAVACIECTTCRVHAAPAALSAQGLRAGRAGSCTPGSFVVSASLLSPDAMLALVSGCRAQHDYCCLLIERSSRQGSGRSVACDSAPSSPHTPQPRTGDCPNASQLCLLFEFLTPCHAWCWWDQPTQPGRLSIPDLSCLLTQICPACIATACHRPVTVCSVSLSLPYLKEPARGLSLIALPQQLCAAVMLKLTLRVAQLAVGNAQHCQATMEPCLWGPHHVPKCEPCAAAVAQSWFGISCSIYPGRIGPVPFQGLQCEYC